MKKLSEQLQTWEQKYPSFFALLAFCCGILGPWTWGLICLPCCYILARRNKELLFFWCLFPFAFGLYSHQHQLFHSRSWQELVHQEGFLKCKVIWDQDMKVEQNRVRGWAWVLPYHMDTPMASLKKRIWVEVKMNRESQLQSSHFLKGSQFTGWTLPDKTLLDFPKLDLAIERATLYQPWYIKWRAMCLAPLDSWKDRDSHRGLAYGLLTGNRQHIQSSTLHHFDRLGLMALLALSGLHVGLVFNLFKKLPYLKHFPLVASTSGIVLVLLYVFLAGWPLSMIRAAAMISLFVLGLFMGRRHIGLNGLVLLALWEWIRNPEVIYRLDFLLSYLGVFGIMWMLKLSAFDFKSKKWYHIPMKIYLVSWGAMLWTWPIVLAFFGKLPHLGWWFAPPMFALFGVIVLYVLFLGLISYLGFGGHEILWIPLEWGNAIFEYLSLGNSWTIPWGAPPLPWIVAYYVLLCAIGLVASLCTEESSGELSEVAF